MRARSDTVNAVHIRPVAARCTIGQSHTVQCECTPSQQLHNPIRGRRRRRGRGRGEGKRKKRKITLANQCDQSGQSGRVYSTFCDVPNTLYIERRAMTNNQDGLARTSAQDHGPAITIVACVYKDYGQLESVGCFYPLVKFRHATAQFF